MLQNFDENAAAPDELGAVLECYAQRIDFCKEAYANAKLLVDPQLRVYAAFKLAHALYENAMYESAAFYFEEVLAVSSILLKKDSKDDMDLVHLTEAKPDYRLEANVYLCKCYLVNDYYQPNNESGKFYLIIQI